MKTFLNTIQGKLISSLAIIALLLGIAAEGVSLYRGWQEVRSTPTKLRKAKPRLVSTCKAMETSTRPSNGSLISYECGQQQLTVPMTNARRNSPNATDQSPLRNKCMRTIETRKTYMTDQTTLVAMLSTAQ